MANPQLWPRNCCFSMVPFLLTCLLRVHQQRRSNSVHGCLPSSEVDPCWNQRVAISVTPNASGLVSLIASEHRSGFRHDVSSCQARTELAGCKLNAGHEHKSEYFRKQCLPSLPLLSVSRSTSLTEPGATTKHVRARGSALSALLLVVSYSCA